MYCKWKFVLQPNFETPSTFTAHRKQFQRVVHVFHVLDHHCIDCTTPLWICPLPTGIFLSLFGYKINRFWWRCDLVYHGKYLQCWHSNREHYGFIFTMELWAFDVRALVHFTHTLQWNCDLWLNTKQHDLYMVFGRNTMWFQSYLIIWEIFADIRLCLI